MNLLKKNHLIVACLCVVSVGQLLAQKVSKFAYNVDRKTGHLKEIFFYNTTNGKIIKTFNVADNDPYGNLSFPLSKASKIDNKIYDLKDLSPSLYSSLLSGKYLSNKGSNSDTTVVIDRLADWVVTSRENETDNFIVVSYNLIAYKNNFPVSFISSLYILDNQGIIVKIIKNLDTESLYPVVSQDGKFLITNYGGGLDCSNNKLLPHSIKIINVSTTEILHDQAIINDNTIKELGKFTSEGSSKPFCINNMFVIVNNSVLNDDNYLYQVFDLAKKKIYIKKCNELSDSEIKKDGFYYKKEKFLFEKDFHIVNFKN